nr:hypothetical protein [Tanacetum cinerariifolium]
MCDVPYVITEVIVIAKLATGTEEAVPEHNVLETYKNTTPEKRAYFDAKVEAEAIHMILNGIKNDIYSTFDACTTAKEIQNGQFVNQRAVNVVRARETVGNQEVLTIDFEPTFDAKPLEKVQLDDEYNVFSNEHKHTQQPENMNDTNLMEKVDRNITHDSSDMCNNEFQDDYYADDNENGQVMLANLIANLKLDTYENKKFQKQLRKANAALTHELNEYKYALAESNDIQDRCRSTLHDQDIELEKYKKFTKMST